MTIVQEDKLRKRIGILGIFLIAPSFYLTNANDTLLLLWFFIAVSLAIVSVGLTYRKYMRDKKQGEDLQRYKIPSSVIWIYCLITLGLLLYNYLN